MSKAFTRESDVEEFTLPPRAPLPAGVKNYITPRGARRLEERLTKLMVQQSAKADSGREARIQQLQQIIATLVIAEPPPTGESVRFGATVTIRRSGGVEKYRLVGVDETDLDKNEISWLSPLAKALLGKRVGEQVPFRAPGGSEMLTVIAIAFDEPEPALTASV